MNKIIRKMPNSKYQRFSDRFFQVSPLLTTPGWYVKLRSGSVLGPFSTKARAQAALFEFFGITKNASEYLIVETAEQQPKYTSNSRGS
jgi:hypothetical protein